LLGPICSLPARSRGLSGSNPTPDRFSAAEEKRFLSQPPEKIGGVKRDNRKLFASVRDFRTLR
jgi:hypothetical protein